jgi:hypothetical protein
MEWFTENAEALAPPELARELKRLRQESELWQNLTKGGLRVYNIDGDRRDHLPERDLLIRGLRKIRPGRLVLNRQGDNASLP